MNGAHTIEVIVTVIWSAQVVVTLQIVDWWWRITNERRYCRHVLMLLQCSWGEGDQRGPIPIDSLTIVATTSCFSSPLLFDF